MEPITLNFEITGDIRYFESAESAASFFKRERQIWSQLWHDVRLLETSTTSNVEQSLKSLWDFSEVMATLEPGSPQWDIRLKQLKQAAKDAPYLVFSDSPEGKRLLKIRDAHGPKTATYAYLALVREDDAVDWIAQQRGFALGELMRQGNWVPEEDELGRIHELAQELDQLLHYSQKSLEVQQSDSRALSETLERDRAEYRHYLDQKVTEYQGTVDEIIRSAKDAHQAQFAAHEERIDLHEQALKARLNTEAARSYWDEESAHHRKWMWVWFAVFVVTACGLLLALVLNYEVEVKAISDIADAGTPALVFMSVAAFLVFWLLRLFSSNWRVHSHKHQDARERVTLIDTYIAMMTHEDSPIRPEDRHLILPTLFRPGSDGLVGEDGIPSPWLDLVSKLMPKR